MTAMNLPGPMDYRDDHVVDGMNGENTGQGLVVKQLNSLLRGEISAAETYRMALDKLSGAAHSKILSSIQEDHGRACQSLRDRIRELGGEASDTSGVWGTWATLVQGASNLMGEAAALKSLKEGEEHGLSDYEEALDDLDTTSVQLINNQLIPTQRQHIQALNHVIQSMGTA